MEGHPRNPRGIEPDCVTGQFAVVAIYRVRIAKQLVRRGEIVATASFFVNAFHVVLLASKHVDAARVRLRPGSRVGELIGAALSEGVAATTRLGPSQSAACPPSFSRN